MDKEITPELTVVELATVERFGMDKAEESF